MDTAVKLFFLAFFLGYRTFRVYGKFDIHPLDIITVALTIKALSQISTKSVSIPKILLFILPFAFIALFNGRITNPGLFDEGLREFKGFLIFYLLFIAFGHYLKKRENFVIALRYYYLAMFLVALIGVLEYYVPPARPFLDAFFKNSATSEYYETDTGTMFFRAMFLFWGTSTVANLMVVAMPFVLVLARNLQNNWLKAYYVLSFGVMIVAVYISGNRAGWLAMVGMAIFFFIFYVNKRFKPKQILRIYLIAILVLSWGIRSLLVDEKFVERFGSGVAVFNRDASEEDLDGSAQLRKYRVTLTWSRVQNNPLGLGWTGSGWVHSDFLQLTANLGWVPGMVFLLAFLSLLFRAAKRAILSANYKNNFDMDLIYALFLAFFATGVQWSINVNYVVSQSGIPLFIVWVMLHVFIVRFDRGDFEEEDRRAKLKKSAA